MDAATTARMAAWNVILEEDLPVGAKVTVEDGWVTIRPSGGQPARVPYSPADTVDSLRLALKDATRTTTQAPRRQAVNKPLTTSGRNTK